MSWRSKVSSSSLLRSIVKNGNLTLSVIYMIRSLLHRQSSSAIHEERWDLLVLWTWKFFTFESSVFTFFILGGYSGCLMECVFKKMLEVNGIWLQVDWLAEKLKEANFTVSAMHGEMEQKEREAIMKEFRAGSRLLFFTIPKTFLTLFKFFFFLFVLEFALLNTVWLQPPSHFNWCICPWFGYSASFVSRQLWLA